MSTLSFITNLIDTKIRNKTPKVVKTEHADVEQALANEFFPAPGKVEWNGSSAVSPTTDTAVTSGIASGILTFEVNFWKHGNKVYCNGEIANISGNLINSMDIIDFLTTLHRPISSSTVYVDLIYVSGSGLSTSSMKIKISSTGFELVGTLAPNPISYKFHTEYIVAN